MLKIIRTILKPIDYFLNRITMYRLVLYVLIALLIIAGIFGYFDLLPYKPMDILFSSVFLMVTCWLLNKFFAFMFDVPTNIESVYITALILALIISPIQGLGDKNFFAIAVWASVWAIASKFIFAINKKHIFNPAAFGVVVTDLFLGLSASWWIGTGIMMPFVAALGLLVVKKIRRFDLVISFLVTAILLIFGNSIYHHSDLIQTAKTVIFDLPIFFLAFIMLTEPATTPPTRSLRVIYGVIVGILNAPFIVVAGIFSTPELALVVGNIFSYLVSPKYKMTLTFKRREQVARDTYDFVFEKDRKFNFKPGQYLEWTLAHGEKDNLGADNRGIRRYFTIASSPTETEIRIGVKFYPEPSSFKNALLNMKTGDKIVASQLSGDFVMPKDKKQKLVFIAGGIGVTPFRSMVKYLIDNGETRDVSIMYSNRELADIAYTKLFDEAYEKLDIKTFYTLTEKEKVPVNWRGNIGYFDSNFIKREIPDYKNCLFYLSGPQSLVLAFEDTLGKMGINRSRIKTDYFPGFA